MFSLAFNRWCHNRFVSSGLVFGTPLVYTFVNVRPELTTYVIH